MTAASAPVLHVETAAVVNRLIDAPLAAGPWDGVAFVLPPPSALSMPSLADLCSLIANAKLLASLGASTPRVVFLTTGAQLSRPLGMSTSVANSLGCNGAWGMARVLQLEVPTFSAVVADVGDGYQYEHILGSIVYTNGGETQLSIQRGRCHAARLRQGDNVATEMHNVPVPGGATHAITGGLGGLGLRAARFFCKDGSSGLVLTSRSGRVAREGQRLDEQLQHIVNSQSRVAILACDVGVRSEALAMITSALSLAPCQPIRYMLHAAGISAVALLRAQTRQGLVKAFTPKALGGWHMHSTTPTVRLETMLLFSSIASGLGDVGLANYASCNACLDGLALSRVASGSASTALQLPLVGSAGMGAAALGGADSNVSRGASNAQSSVLYITLEEYAMCLAQEVLDARSLKAIY
eukprot:scaffold324571_cov68-Tisochrysis_lutea.AAC.1